MAWDSEAPMTIERFADADARTAEDFHGHIDRRITPDTER